MSDYPASLDVRPLITWRPVPGWPSVEASTDGRLRVHGVVRAPRIERNGYCFVQLGNRRARLWVHHAVLLAFAGPRPNGNECRHLDGDPSNNAVTNLAWGTRAQQIEDQRRHGTLPAGEAKPGARLTDEQVRAIRLDDRSLHAIARDHGVSHTTVHKVRTRQKWAHVPDRLEQAKHVLDQHGAGA